MPHLPGLLDVAADPHLAVSHFVHLLSTVGPDSPATDVAKPVCGRRERCMVSAADSNQIDPATRVARDGRRAASVRPPAPPPAPDLLACPAWTPFSRIAARVWLPRGTFVTTWC